MEEKASDLIRKKKTEFGNEEKKALHTENFLIAVDNNEWIAFPVSKIVETYQINSQKELIKIPLTEPYIAGVVNIRGDMVPVLSFLRICGKNAENGNHIVVIEEGFKLGFIVQSVVEITEMESMKIKTMNPIQELPYHKFVYREFEYLGKIVRIIDIPKLFQSPYIA